MSNNKNLDNLRKRFRSQNKDEQDISQDNTPITPLVSEPILNKDQPLSKKKKVTRENYALFPHEEEESNYHSKTLRLICKNGRKISFSYDYKPLIDYDPASDDNHCSITLTASLAAIIIKGQRLETLFEHLSEHEVDWINESASQYDNPEHETFISEILVRKNE